MVVGVVTQTEQVRSTADGASNGTVKLHGLEGKLGGQTLRPGSSANMDGFGQHGIGSAQAVDSVVDVGMVERACGDCKIAQIVADVSPKRWGGCPSEHGGHECAVLPLYVSQIYLRWKVDVRMKKSEGREPEEGGKERKELDIV